jgi:hypothetical protein
MHAIAAAGAVDDLAIMPLLRRGVKNIIACVATHTNPEGSMADFAKGENNHHCNPTLQQRSMHSSVVGALLSE